MSNWLRCVLVICFRKNIDLRNCSQPMSAGMPFLSNASEQLRYRENQYMKESQKSRINNIVKKLPTLTNGQLFWLDRVIAVFDVDHRYELFDSDIIDQDILSSFGDAMRIHHSFSVEPFSKDKFEYVLEQTLNIDSTKATLASKGNRGHDITINEVRFSLKTQADKGIKEHMIWISKFMELGKGQWGDNPTDLEGLLHYFLEHMKNYERILTLRTLKKSPRWRYELVEIPKELLLEACNGKLEMMMNSVQMPKPGYCYVADTLGNTKYQLYFDGGGERKLQVKNLLKKYCTVHASWEFTIPV